MLCALALSNRLQPRLSMKKMHLEDALEDSPGTRNLLKLMEEDSVLTRDYSSSLQGHLGKVLDAQSNLCNALGSLSQHLKSYRESGSFNKPSSILPDILTRFAINIDELSSMHQISISQITDGLTSLKKFVFGDISELFVLKEVFNSARNELNRVHGNHLKFPKKREKEKHAKELNDEMFVVRKKFHEAALKYYLSLNWMQIKKITCTIEPLLSLIKANVTYSELSSDFVKKLTEDDFCSNMEAAIQSFTDELALDKMRAVEEVECLGKDSVQKYFVEAEHETVSPLPTDSRQKAGYLMLRSKTGLLTSKWDQYYFFIQGGCLMYQGADEMAGHSLADLGLDTHVEPSDFDDRRFVFTIHQPALKKQIVLQADSCHERRDWMTTIKNASLECSYQRHSSSPAGCLQLQEKSDKGTLLLDAPIQFDIITPCHKSFPDALCKNPFDGDGKTQSSDGTLVDVLKEFPVGFMGSKQVASDRGDNLLKETMRQIMAARAMHNLFKMPQYKLVVTQHCVMLVDAQVNIIKSEFKLEDISFWGVHEDNKRLFGFITRMKNVNEEPNFICHVFECNTGEQICETLALATHKAYEAFLMKKDAHVTDETEILLKNIKEETDDLTDKI